MPTFPSSSATKPAAVSGEVNRWATLNYFADVTARTVRPLAALVWFHLFRHAKPDGMVCITQAELSRRIGRTERSIYSALRQLEKVGLLLVVRRGTEKVGPSIYRMKARRSDDL